MAGTNVNRDKLCVTSVSEQFIEIYRWLQFCLWKTSLSWETMHLRGIRTPLENRCNSRIKRMCTNVDCRWMMVEDDRVGRRQMLHNGVFLRWKWLYVHTQIDNRNRHAETIYSKSRISCFHSSQFSILNHPCSNSVSTALSNYHQRIRLLNFSLDSFSKNPVNIVTLDTFFISDDRWVSLIDFFRFCSVVGSFASFSSFLLCFRFSKFLRCFLSVFHRDLYAREESPRALSKCQLSNFGNASSREPLGWLASTTRTYKRVT